MIIALAVAFIAGLASFIAPCILPLVPAYLAYIGGVSEKDPKSKKRILVAAICFVTGFVVVFAVLGLLLQSVLLPYVAEFQILLQRIGGVAVVLFALSLIGVIRVPAFSRSVQFTHLPKDIPVVTPLLFGAAFAAGWTPCVSPMLASIVALAAAEPSYAFLLLLSYGFGLGLPFIVIALFSAPLLGFASAHEKLFSALTILFGGILLAVGVLLFTGDFNTLTHMGLAQKCLALIR